MAILTTQENGWEMLAVSNIIAKSPDTLSSIIGNEAVVILPELGELKVLNEVGARLWELADGQKTIADLVDIICEEYAALPQQVEQDAIDFLEQMLNKKMIVLVK